MSKNGTRTISLILKITVVISAIVGTILSALAGRAAFMGGSRVFMYFTIQSNIAVALISLIGIIKMLREQQYSHTWYVIQFVGAVAITLTGMVFCFVLAPTMGKYAWNLQNVLTHVVVPVAAVADMFVSGKNSTMGKKDILYVTLPPLAYALYAGIGYAAGWEFSRGKNYPYFFLNWGSPAGAFGFTKELPFMGCVWWIIALLIFLILTGRLYLFILDLIRKKQDPARR